MLSRRCRYAILLVSCVALTPAPTSSLGLPQAFQNMFNKFRSAKDTAQAERTSTESSTGSSTGSSADSSTKPLWRLPSWIPFRQGNTKTEPGPQSNTEMLNLRTMENNVSANDSSQGLDREESATASEGKSADKTSAKEDDAASTTAEREEQHERLGVDGQPAEGETQPGHAGTDGQPAEGETQPGHAGTDGQPGYNREEAEQQPGLDGSDGQANHGLNDAAEVNEENSPPSPSPPTEQNEAN